jgi:predicted helicase
MGEVNFNQFIPLLEIFENSISGVKTHRDHFVVGFTVEEIKQKMNIFVGNLPDDLVAQALKLKDTKSWKIKVIRESVRKKDWSKAIIPYSYRPFDRRQICYLPELIDRDRLEVMRNFFDANMGLIVDRTTSVGVPYSHVFVSDTLMDVRALPDYGGAPFLVPLYLYPLANKKDLFSQKEGGERRRPNVNYSFYVALRKTFGNSFSPEETFYYIYAVLYSNIYRTKYAEFLKIDFPRVPFTKDYEVFSRMAELGKRLVDLHLLKSPELETPIAKFQGKGEDKVEKVRYESERVYINGDQYFEGVPREAWEYQIGGYQVCDKWLKDRKGRKLSLEDTKHYCKVATAIQGTIEIQRLIDDIYPTVEKEIIVFKKEAI